MDYRGEIGNRNRWIAEYQAKIATLEAELNQLWRDEGIANVGHEVPLDWRGNPQPMLCRKCRKEPVLVTKKQRQVDAVVEGQLIKVWQDYYRYQVTVAHDKHEIWCKKCSDEYYAVVNKLRKDEEWRRRYHKEHPNEYDGGC